MNLKDMLVLVHTESFLQVWHLMSSPAHEPPSGPSSVPAAHGHKHLGNVSSGRLSPAPPAGSWWRWCDCASSCLCYSQPHFCPWGWRGPSPAARSVPSSQAPSGSGSCLPSREGPRSGASRTLSGRCCLYLHLLNLTKGHKETSLQSIILCSFKGALHQLYTWGSIDTFESICMVFLWYCIWIDETPPKKKKCFQAFHLYWHDCIVWNSKGQRQNWTHNHCRSPS